MFERPMLRVKSSLFRRTDPPQPEAAAEPPPIADSVLVVRMTQGDRAALAELYDRHAQTLFALAHSVLRDRPEAEDVIHDVFLEAWRQAADYSETRGTVRAWLLVRARCRALDKLRSNVRRHGVLNSVMSEQAQQRTTPTDRVGHGDRHRLPAALAQMPEQQQRVIQLAYFEGLSTVEISSRLGIPMGTVKSRTHAALITLRNVLGVLDE